jgi:phytoene synthase
MLPDPTYCAQQVQRHDRDRFLCTLFAPRAAQADIFALLAFNIEISRIVEAVQEEMIGHIRFTWWREVVEDLFAGRPAKAHPVAEALKPVIESGAHAQEQFIQLIEARQACLPKPRFAGMEELLAYSQITGGLLLQLIAQAAGIRDVPTLFAAQKFGTAYALTGHLRSLHHQRQHGLSYLPELYGSASWTNKTVAPVAQAMLAIARTLLDEVEPYARLQLLKPYRIITHHHAKNLRRHAAQLLDYTPPASDLRLTLRLLLP